MTSQIFLVSYPRSGQHYCQRLLQRVSGKDDYCELYRCFVEDCPGKRLSVKERTPCLAGRRIQKTHDFDLDFPILENARYAVLVRRPLHSLVSYYEHASRNGRGVNIDGVIQPHTPDAMRAFFTVKARYWRDFTLRWLDLAERHDFVRVFDYQGLISDRDVILDFCDFTLGDYPVETAAALADKQVSAFREGLVGKGKVDSFRHPTEAVLPILHDIIEPGLLSRAGVEAYS